MKKISKFCKLMLGVSSACFAGGIAAAYVNSTAIVNNKTQALNNTKNDNVQTKEIDAKLIGADEGKVTIEYTNPSECKIVSCSDFRATGDYNFNGGKFSLNGVEYTITEIGDNAFHPGYFDKFFVECNLTIPSTIKKIGKKAFAYCQRALFWTKKEIISLTFQEGIEYIEEDAFEECLDITTKKLILPNSVKYIGNNAFAGIRVEELELSTLDHVIEINVDLFDHKNGFVSYSGIKTIWLRDKDMKAKYGDHKYWTSAWNMFRLKY